MKKKMLIANCNIVFFDDDKNEYPLLDYFDSIVYPVFVSGIQKKVNNNTYSIMNVNVLKMNNGEYALVGNFVKETELEVKSNIDEHGNLVECDYTYPTAPYSTFVIYLKNHRMVFVPNQKGSPTIKNFQSALRLMFFHYIKMINDNLMEDEKKLPWPEINITSIPKQGRLSEVLEGVKSVKQLTLRFCPLNDDLNIPGAMDFMARELRRAVDSKSGEIILKSPKHIDGVIKIIEESRGTVEPILRVKYQDDTEKTIKDDKIAEKVQIEIPNNTVYDDFEVISRKGRESLSTCYISDEHVRTYERNIEKIEKML